MPPDINWNESAPPTTASAGLGAQEFQSLKTAIRTGLNAEHTWDPSGLGAGIHRLGSARAYYGAQSLVSSSGTDGRLMVTSDTSILCHVGSAGTMFLGSQRAISAGSTPVGGQRFYWAQEFGVDQVVSANYGTVSFPNSGYSGLPFVVASAWSDHTPVNRAIAVSICTLTATTFTYVLTDTGTGGSVSKCSIMWHSIGTRIL